MHQISVVLLEMGMAHTERDEDALISEVAK